MNAVIYARYSSEGQREESIDGQIRECMEYCKQNGMTVVKEYIDRALSAKTDNRPDFQRMIKDSAKGLFDVVVVWKLDRFARNRYDSAHYKAALKKNGVRVISAKENIADGPEGIILESMLEGMAEYYSAELSVKVIRGHTENALKCKYNGGTPTFGFAIDANKQYQPDPVNAPIVLDIFKMYDTGSTMKQIMDHLNALGVTTVRGKPADLNFISGILHNRKYIGEYKYRDIVVPDGIPALVPTDLFERVQEQMKKNQKAPARHKAEDDYLLTTKLFCGSCKAMMVGESGTSSSKGQVYHYYRCVNSKRKKTCKAKHRSVRKDPLERAVVASVMRNIMDDAFVEYFTDQALALQGQESNELPALRRQLADTEKAIDNMLNAIQAGIFNASTKRRLDELEATKEKLELSIIKEEMKKPQFTREQIQFYILQFRKVDTNTLEGRRRLIDGFVNSVVVYDDYILVTFNYKEGAERITFEQIERSDLSSFGGPIRKPLRLNGLRIFYFFLPIVPDRQCSYVKHPAPAAQPGIIQKIAQQERPTSQHNGKRGLFRINILRIRSPAGSQGNPGHRAGQRQQHGDGKQPQLRFGAVDPVQLCAHRHGISHFLYRSHFQQLHPQQRHAVADETFIQFHKHPTLYNLSIYTKRQVSLSFLITCSFTGFHI